VKKRKTQRRATNGATLPGIVAGNLMNLRQRRKLTLAAFAEKVKFSASYISTMEHGLRTPTLANIERISRAFNVPADKFLRKGAVR